MNSWTSSYATVWASWLAMYKPSWPDCVVQVPPKKAYHHSSPTTPAQALSLVTLLHFPQVFWWSASYGIRTTQGECGTLQNVRQLFTGWIKSWLTPLSMSGLTIEMLLPVSTVISHGLPWMVPETVRLSPPPWIKPVLKMSNSQGTVDDPAKFTPQAWLIFASWRGNHVLYLLLLLQLGILLPLVTSLITLSANQGISSGQIPLSSGSEQLRWPAPWSCKTPESIN